MELAPRKVIVIIILLFVLFLVGVQINSIISFFVSSTYSLDEKTCNSNPDLVKSKYINCDLKINDCSKKEKEKWINAKKYLGEKDCSKLSLDNDKENDCTCIQNIIFNLKSEKSKENGISKSSKYGILENFNYEDYKNYLDLNPSINYKNKFKYKVSSGFFDKINSIAKNLGTKPEYLVAIINFETAGTFKPCIKNPYNGATGLIQFTKQTAKDLGTTTDKLCKMSQLEQLDFVEKYLVKYKGRLNTLSNIYMAVLMPSMIGKPPEQIIAEQGDKYYKNNQNLDKNKDGKILIAEAIYSVSKNYG